MKIFSSDGCNAFGEKTDLNRNETFRSYTKTNLAIKVATKAVDIAVV